MLPAEPAAGDQHVDALGHYARFPVRVRSRLSRRPYEKSR
jgi:hypothetical protein